MAKDQNKKVAENTFWKSWEALESKGDNNTGQNEGSLDRHEAMDYAERIAQQQALEKRKDNLKLLVAVAVGVLAVFVIVYVLGLIDIKPKVSNTGSGEVSQQPPSQSAAESSIMSADEIEQAMAKGGFATKEAYYGSVLKKQSADVGDGLDEFSKKIKSATPKLNITALVIAQKMEQLTKNKIYQGFGIELADHADSESDNVQLISHLNGQTSSVEFFAEDGRVVAHFKDYPPSYCASTNGAAVCGE